MTHTPRLHRVRDQRALADEKTCRLNKAAPDMLEALEEVVAITENLPVCPFCGAVKAIQSHRPDCLSHEIDQTIQKARGVYRDSTTERGGGRIWTAYAVADSPSNLKGRRGNDSQVDLRRREGI